MYIIKCVQDVYCTNLFFKNHVYKLIIGNTFKQLNNYKTNNRVLLEQFYF